jgi:hypothetical protein
MITIESKESKMNFFEFIREIKEKYIQAFKVFSKVKDGNEEKTKNEWQNLFNEMLNKKTK